MHIITGQYRGRRLQVPQSKITRPTLTRVRQILFDTLRHSGILPRDWSQMHVLDVCAGSGSLGLEALSRGACWVGFYENNPEAQQTLRHNIRHLGVEQSCALYEDALKPQAHRPPIDLILCDPPYANHALWQQHMASHKANGGLAQGALLVVQVPKRAVLLQPQAILRQKQIGITRLDFYDVDALSHTR